MDENVINHPGQADKPGLQTGFCELDILVGGLQASDLGIIAGRPGTGKTSLLLSIIRNVAVKERKRVALFTLEMSGEQLAQRLIAQEISMDVQRLRSGKLEVDEKRRYGEAIELLQKVPLFVNDTSIVSINQIRSACHKLSLERDLIWLLLTISSLSVQESVLTTASRKSPI